jgi:cytochrome c biogenesis protein CcmG, thiol:disulfide interchange protein DsbE
MIMLGAGLFVMGLASIIALIQSAPKPENSQTIYAIPVKVEYPAPELSVKTLSEAPVSLEDMRGQVVLLNNWATWCPPCREEMPELEAFYKAYKDNGFTLVAINAGETRAEVSEFVDRYGLTFPIWLDQSNAALGAFRNMRLPNSYLIDKDGVVRLAWTGAISFEMLEKHITPYLEE